MRVEQFVLNVTDTVSSTALWPSAVLHERPHLPSSIPVWDCVTNFGLNYYSNLLKVVNRDIQCPHCLRFQTRVLGISDDPVLQTAAPAPGAYVSQTGTYLVVLYACHFCRWEWANRYPVNNALISYAGQLDAP